MSNAIFPTFPGLAWSVYKTPEWSTSAQRAVSGKEIRMANRARPVWLFSLSYEILRGASVLHEYQTLLAFYNARQGSFDSFLFNDTSDNTATAQVIGTGNGTQTTWTLTHQIDTWSEPVGGANPLGLKVFVNGTDVNGAFNLVGNTVVLNTPPPAASTITWSGQFYYRMRFDKDTMEFEQFMRDFWALKKCDLRGVI